MAERGAYAKGIEKRNAILATALEVIAARGFHKTTVRDLAEAAGTSTSGLLHYFGTKEELFIEILRRRDADAAAQEPPAVPGEIEGLIDIGRRNAEVPGLVQLYAQFSTAAAEEGHPARPYFQERFAEYRERIGRMVVAEQAAGRMPASLDPTRFATILAAVTDGLQTQWMLDESIDMSAHIRYLFELVGADVEHGRS
ncbi:TetR family transcriptional regulator [Curtobacterium sp. MCJR17_055]|uniref:TetR/AcrR family transcriptional regulator n=1 Tax=unclassified Curtobacterium TaxID=257496 RepID=UPI000D9F5FA2|nr:MULTISPECIES: TetR/AcrR family transcriptional regulator [unclassified Curtobacterium]PYY38146.1 TetR family transcriptional regulator [Curtobacterium sp. MCBD17_029]PYY56891.1 TetR family transcriptional regulator [Curtobacterium sp. MCJR17_055]PYY62451.1 TetR family transcriptional regulator [Curtobacterium sp. MCPF17_015]PZE37229.1 TetR family transcriptional regulator [Curtobacterium sp. MCPF17_031]